MSGAQVRLVVTDMDGTFLDSENNIPPENKQAVKCLHEKNIPFVIATGRMMPMVQEYVRQLQLVGPVVGYNGGMIREIKTGKTIFQKCFAAEAFARVLEYGMAHRLDYLVYTSDSVYAPDYSVRIRAFHEYNRLARRGGSALIPIFPIEALSGDRQRQVMKILVQNFSPSDLETAAEFIGSLHGVHCEHSMPHLIDVMPEGVDKGNALHILCQYYGISLEQVCVFGDQRNDIVMFKAAGVSFCMRNGHEEAKKHATYIAESNDDAGFAQALKRYGVVE